MNSNTVNHENQDNTGYSTQQQTYCSVDPSMATSDVRNVSTVSQAISSPRNSHDFQTDHSAYANMQTPQPSSTNPLPRNPIQGIIPVIGSLHIALNAQENIMKVYHKVFKFIYESIFKGSKLADKPKPWRVTMSFEILWWLDAYTT